MAWHVAVGDTVAEDQVLADVMTDKATVEIPSPVAGTVRTLGGDVGQLMAVGASLIEIAVDGDDTAAPDDAAQPGTVPSQEAPAGQAGATP